MTILLTYVTLDEDVFHTITNLVTFTFIEFVVVNTVSAIIGKGAVRTFWWTGVVGTDDIIVTRKDVIESVFVGEGLFWILRSCLREDNIVSSIYFLAYA